MLQSCMDGPVYLTVNEINVFSVFAIFFQWILTFWLAQQVLFCSSISSTRLPLEGRVEYKFSSRPYSAADSKLGTDLPPQRQKRSLAWTLGYFCSPVSFGT